jgi:hypothetical protein
LEGADEVGDGVDDRVEDGDDVDVGINCRWWSSCWYWIEDWNLCWCWNLYKVGVFKLGCMLRCFNFKNISKFGGLTSCSLPILLSTMTPC